MTPESVEEGLRLAFEGVQGMGLAIALTPVDLGISDEEFFSQDDLPLLISALNDMFGEFDVVDPDEDTVFLGTKDDVSLVVETLKPVNMITYFFVPEGYKS